MPLYQQLNFQVSYLPLKCHHSPFNSQGHLFSSFAQEEQLLNSVLKTSSEVCNVSLQTILSSASLFFPLESFFIMPNLSYPCCNLNSLFLLLSAREKKFFLLSQQQSFAYLRNIIILPSPTLNLLSFKQSNPNAVILPGRSWFPALRSFLQLPSGFTPAGLYLSGNAAPNATQSTPAETLSLLSKADRYLFKMVYEFSVLHLVISKGNRESALLQRAVNYPLDPDPNRFSY